MSERRSFLLVLALLAAQLVAFALLDRRPLNDHDPEFAGVAVQDAIQIQHAGSMGERLGVLGRRLFRHGERHPQLPQTLLAAWTGLTGWSRLHLRLSNLPWLLVLLVGTYLAARELATARTALLAMWLAGTLPLVIHMSRKWFPHLHAAALAPLALWLVLRLRDDARRQRWGPWLALGAVQGLRLYTHPIGAPDVAILYGLLALVLLAQVDGRAWIGRLLGAVAVTGLLASPALFAGAVHEDGVGLAGYLALVAHYLSADWITSGRGWMETLARLGAGLGWAALPGAALVLLLGGARAPGVLRSDPWARLLGLRLALHVPAMVLTVGNDAFLADWLLLAPDVAILAALGLARFGRGVVGLAVAQGAITLALPLLLSLSQGALVGSNGGLRALFAHSEHGGAWNTHHLLVRTPAATTAIAEALPPDTDVIGVIDLTFGAERCGMSAGAWVWEAAEPGFSALPGQDAFAEHWARTPEWRLGAERPAVIRVWAAGQDGGCTLGADTAAPLVEQARGVAERRFGEAPTVVADPAQLTLSAPRPSSEPVPGYAGALLLR